MMMGAFWLVFDVILKTGGPDYLPFLLIGLTLWQWMKSCITHGGYAIWSNLAMVRQVRLPPLVFPLVADAVRHGQVRLHLRAAAGDPVVRWAIRRTRRTSRCRSLFAAMFLAAAGAGFVVAALVPLLPDLRFVIEQVLMVVMFLSGVVFSLDAGAAAAAMADGAQSGRGAHGSDARGILMHGQLPNWVGLGKVGAISLVACAARRAVRAPPRAALSEAGD